MKIKKVLLDKTIKKGLISLKYCAIAGHEPKVPKNLK